MSTRKPCVVRGTAVTAALVSALVAGVSGTPARSTAPEPVDVVGHYQCSPDDTMTVMTRATALWVRRTGRFREPLERAGSDTWLALSSGVTLRYVRGEQRLLDQLEVTLPDGILRCPRTSYPVFAVPPPVAARAEPAVFAPPEARPADSARALPGLRRVGDLFLLSLAGDYEAVLAAANARALAEMKTTPASVGCTLFASTARRQRPMLGRNYDTAPGGVLVTRTEPPNALASIAFTRLADLGFAAHEDLTALPPEEQRRLLEAPFFAVDGINERGVAVAIARVGPAPVRVDPNRPGLFITGLVREILDHAGNVEDAITLARRYNVVDAGPATVSHHLLIADASPRSVVLEWVDGAPVVSTSASPWQVATNTKLYHLTEEERRLACERYEITSRALEVAEGDLDWHGAMAILRRVSITGKNLATQWSAVLDLHQRCVFVALERRYNEVLRLGF